MPSRAHTRPVDVLRPRARVAARSLLALAALALLTALAWLDAVALLLAAPWLAAVAWLAIRLGPSAVAPGNAEPLPSAAERHLRRR
jgi:hypothetical protein